MRLPLSWLADHVDPGLGADDLAERLTRSGTKVEAVVRRGAPGGNGNLGAFRVGVVVSAEPHPGADRLRLCRVDVGGGGAPADRVRGAQRGRRPDRRRGPSRRRAARRAPAARGGHACAGSRATG